MLLPDGRWSQAAGAIRVVHPGRVCSRSMTDHQMLIDPSNGDIVELAVDHEQLTLEIDDVTQTFESAAALEDGYRVVARDHYARGFVDSETSSERLLDFARCAEGRVIATRVSVPADAWSDAEIAMTVDVILAISAAVRHACPEAPIERIRVGRGEFTYANVELDETVVLASAMAEDNAMFFTWADILLDMFETTTGSDAVQLYHAEILGARIAARIEADALLPDDVAARLAPTCTIHVCSFDEHVNSTAEREAAAAGLSKPLSKYLAVRFVAE
jgi:hypothetical protein